MPTPPLRTALADAYPKPSNEDLRTGLGRFWDYATTLLGLAGTPAGARAALGVPQSETGVIIQSGNVTTDANGTALVIFPMAYPGGQPRIAATVFVGSYGSYGVNLTNRSAGGFTANITLGNVAVPNLSFDWHAIGK